LGVLIPAIAVSAAPLYVVQKGETLSGILQRLSFSPIYGEEGALAKTLKLNRNLGNGDRILPGDGIELPARPTDPSLGDSSAPDRIIADVDDVSSSFSLGLGLDYFRIDASDLTSGSHSTILSTLSPSLRLGYRLQWNASTAVLVGAHFERYHLQPAKNADFDHSTGFRSGFSAGLSQKFSSRLEALLRMDLQERLFFHASGATELAVDSIPIGAPTVAIQYAVFKKPSAEIGVRGEFGLLLPASNADYDVRSGTHGDVGVFIRRDPPASNHAFECRFDFVLDSQDSSIMTEREKRFLLNLSYFWGE